VIANLMASAVTFKKCTAEKLCFILLNFLDLGLTVFAVSSGLNELNPLMRHMLDVPYQLVLVKIGMPVLMAWLVPGKLLIPAAGLLAVIVGWDIRQLVIYFV
jgi:hypothetical protein